MTKGKPLRLAGALLLGGFLLNAVVTMAWHPSGEEDDHPRIFSEYAQSDGWVATHLGQYVGVLLALAGLLVLAGVLRRGAPSLALFAVVATIITAASWTVLQALDGVALKEAVDAWVAASEPEKASRFYNAETVRWLEWGFQSYFRVAFGLALLLLGAALLTSRCVAAWLGVVAVVAGLLSVAVGFDVGYNGLDGDFQDTATILFQLVVLVFVTGVLVAGLRRGGAGEGSAGLMGVWS